MDYRIEQVNKKYHPDLICEVVLSALAEVYLAGSSTRWGENKTTSSNSAKIIAKVPRMSLIV